MTLSGLGEVAVEADIVRVGLAVSGEADTAAAAMAAVSGEMRKVLDVLRFEGIERRDLKTAAVRLDPVYAPQVGTERRPPRVLAYRATNAVDVTVRKVADLGALLDRAVGAGTTSVRGVVFDVDDRAKAEAEARRRAVEHAKAKAAEYAAGIGARLGPVVTLSEEGVVSRAPQLSMARDMAASIAVPVEPGETMITARVSVTFRLE